MFCSMRPLRVGAFFVLVACFLAPLVAHAYLSSFSRFMADEYCFAAAAKSKGIFPAAHYWYATWTGRFSADLVDSVIGFVGPCVAPYVATVALAVWLLVLIIVIYQFTCPRDPGRFWSASLIATLILFSTLEVAPAVTQSIYWGQGLRSVIPPLILGLMFVALAQRVSMAGKTPQNILSGAVVGGLLTFAAGGFSETYLCLQTSLLAVVLIAGLVTGAPRFRTHLFPVIVAGLCGSILSGILVVLAPGNTFRQAFYPPPPHLIDLTRIAAWSMLEFLARIPLAPTNVATVLGALVLSMLVGAKQISSHNPGTTTHAQVTNAKALLWIPPITAIALFSCFVPAAYGTSSSPPGRTLIIPYFCLVCALSAGGYIRGLASHQVGPTKARDWKSIARRLLIWPICFLLGLNAVRATYETVRLKPVFAKYASYWDETHRTILAAKLKGAASVTVPLVRNWAGLQDPGPADSVNWVNNCFNDYYGVDVSIRYTLEVPRDTIVREMRKQRMDLP